MDRTDPKITLVDARTGDVVPVGKVVRQKQMNIDIHGNPLGETETWFKVLAVRRLWFRRIEVVLTNDYMEAHGLTPQKMVLPIARQNGMDVAILPD